MHRDPVVQAHPKAVACSWAVVFQHRRSAAGAVGVPELFPVGAIVSNEEELCSCHAELSPGFLGFCSQICEKSAGVTGVTGGKAGLILYLGSVGACFGLC